jgi:ABC-type bacteriocin/lantibiotic exporter with double-glycine peptidase domain
VKYFQPAAKLRLFREICKPLPYWGLSTKKMLACLRQQGLHVSARTIEFSEIRDAINNKRPVLTSIGGPDNDDHWIVIYGFTDTHIMFAGKTVPGFTRTKMHWETFKKHCNSTMLIVYD